MREDRYRKIWAKLDHHQRTSIDQMIKWVEKKESETEYQNKSVKTREKDHNVSPKLRELLRARWDSPEHAAIGAKFTGRQVCFLLR